MMMSQIQSFLTLEKPYFLAILTTAPTNSSNFYVMCCLRFKSLGSLIDYIFFVKKN